MIVLHLMASLSTHIGNKSLLAKLLKDTLVACLIGIITPGLIGKILQSDVFGAVVVRYDAVEIRRSMSATRVWSATVPYIKISF